MRRGVLPSVPCLMCHSVQCAQWCVGAGPGQSPQVPVPDEPSDPHSIPEPHTRHNGAVKYRVNLVPLYVTIMFIDLIVFMCDYLMYLCVY